MSFIVKGCRVYIDNRFTSSDIVVSDEALIDFSPVAGAATASVFSFNNCILIPGLTDVHVHLREPGFSYKETIESGTAAAAKGGYTAVCAMPNVNPVPDCAENLNMELDLIRKGARVRVYPYGSVTKGQSGEQLSDFEEISDFVIAFSDDGRGVQSDELMEAAILKAKQTGKIIASHCEDNRLLCGGWIHDGEYARLHGHRGISSESEWRQLERDLRLVAKTGCSYHACHISTKESVQLIRDAKRAGLDVTAETAPHYLCLTDMDLQEDGRFKMNPPLRSEADRLALTQAVCDGTIDMIATDHAPHSAEEKNRGLEKSSMGVVGLETAFPVMYTKMVKTGLISLEKLIGLMHFNPAERFKIKMPLRQGAPANFTVFDLNTQYTIDPEKFLSGGKSTPFAGDVVFGKCMLTVSDGKIVWQDKD